MLKDFINDFSEVVREMIEGIVSAFPYHFEYLQDRNSVLYTQRRKNKVALVTGGGSGHEPLFLGFVGQGLADAAVCGNLYNAPNPDNIYETAKAVENGHGVLFLYGNYPGDIMNFDIAEERLNAEGIPTRHIRIHDDVSSAPSTRKSERRGIAGDVFLLRIVGAACDAGLSMDEIVKMAESVNDNIWSIAVAITERRNQYLLKESEFYEEGNRHVEYGIGLHGERGILRMDIQPVDHLVNQMYSQCMDEANLKVGDEVSILINGLGSVSIMELAIVFQRVRKLLEGDHLRLYDADINNYCSSYESNGFSITILKMDETIKQYYSAPCYSPYYSHKADRPIDNRMVCLRKAMPAREFTKPVQYVPAKRPEGPVYTLDTLMLRDMMIYVANNLIENEEYLSKLDSLAGDGDHGICIANGMKCVILQLKKIGAENTPYDVYQMIGKTMLLVAGGASGAFFGSMYKAAAEVVRNKIKVNTADFAEMWQEALRTVEKKGGAKRGDKTMIDALEPAVTAIQKNLAQDFAAALSSASDAAERGMEETKMMRAKFGRGKFLAERALGCQDAGATTIWITFRSMWQYIAGDE